MKLNETLRGILRRWYVLVAGLLITAAAAMFLYNKTDVHYEASGSILLFAPVTTVGPDGNPYLYLGGMTQATDVLTRRSSAPEITGSVLKEFPNADYKIASDPTTSSPIVVVTAIAPTGEETLQTLNAALKSVSAMLETMQTEDAVKPAYRIRGKELVVAGEANLNNKTQLQLTILVIAGGVVATVLAAGAVDGIMLQRQKRKSPRPKKAEKKSTPIVDSELVKESNSP